MNKSWKKKKISCLQSQLHKLNEIPFFDGRPYFFLSFFSSASSCSFISVSGGVLFFRAGFNFLSFNQADLWVVRKCQSSVQTEKVLLCKQPRSYTGQSNGLFGDSFDTWVPERFYRVKRRHTDLYLFWDSLSLAVPFQDIAVVKPASVPRWHKNKNDLEWTLNTMPGSNTVFLLTSEGLTNLLTKSKLFTPDLTKFLLFPSNHSWFTLKWWKPNQQSSKSFPPLCILTLAMGWLVLGWNTCIPTNLRPAHKQLLGRTSSSLHPRVQANLSASTFQYVVAVPPWGDRSFLSGDAFCGSWLTCVSLSLQLFLRLHLLPSPPSLPSFALLLIMKWLTCGSGVWLPFKEQEGNGLVSVSSERIGSGPGRKNTKAEQDLTCRLAAKNRDNNW